MMKRMVLVVVVVAVVAGSQSTSGQAIPNLFIDFSDTGDILHVLPPETLIHSLFDSQPTFAPADDKTAVYLPSYGVGPLIDHRGPEIPNAAFFAVYWNSSVASGHGTSLGYSTIQEQLTEFINQFPDNHDWDNSLTDDYVVIQQYGSQAPIANTLQNWGALVDIQPTRSTITDSQIRRYLAFLFNTGQVPASRNTIYGVYFPPGMRVTLQGGASCTSFCGYHGFFNYAGMSIKYAAFPYLNCQGCVVAGLSVADMLTIVSSHEIRETVTDPNLNAWYDGIGYEADDKCAWHNLYQMTRGGFWVQPEYSNGGPNLQYGVIFPGPGCIVPNR